MSFSRFHYHPTRQMSESLLTAAILSVSGGLQDVYTYVSRGHVFANAQTGNIVLMSQDLFSGDFGKVIHYFVPVLFFSLGVAAATFIRQKLQDFEKLHWRQIVVILEIVLLFSVGFMPEELNLIANAMVSFSCAMQVQSFRKVNNYAFASTMCIGNIRSGMEALCSYHQTHNIQTLYKSFHYFGIILLFALGAGFGSICIPVLGMHTIWISCLLLSVSFLIMFIQEEEQEKDQ
jgi:uncharacterized membrane protein YoaK (UPF0700 family)